MTDTPRLVTDHDADAAAQQAIVQRRRRERTERAGKAVLAWVVLLVGAQAAVLQALGIAALVRHLREQ